MRVAAHPTAYAQPADDRGVPVGPPSARRADVEERRGCVRAMSMEHPRPRPRWWGVRRATA